MRGVGVNPDDAVAGMRHTRYMNNLVRPRNGAVIAGVCAALANRFGWPVTLVRVIAVASILIPGPQVIIYVILWALIPKER